MFYRNKKTIKLEYTLIISGLSSKEGAFELRNLAVHPKYLLLLHTALITY